MSARRVRYYFAFSSPYAALADTQIDALVEETGAGLAPIPIVAPPADPPQGIAATILEHKRSYAAEDAARWAARLGVPWRPHEGPVDPTDASLGYWFAAGRGVERGYRKAVLRARYGEARDISDRGVLTECAQALGLPRDEFLAALDDERTRRAFEEGLRTAFNDRVFGVPLFVVDGTRFWGNDRLDFLAEALRR